MGLTISNPKYVPSIIDQIQQRTMGLRIKYDGKNLVSGVPTPKVVKIPDSIKDLHSAATWMRENQGITKETSLGTFGANDNFVIMNMCHCMADGKFATLLAEELSQDDIPNIKPLEGIPIDVSQYFKKQMSENREIIPYCASNPNISRFVSKVQNPVKSRFVNSKQFRFPLKDLVCYQNGKVNKLFEHQCMAAAISFAAMTNNKNNYYMRCSIPVNIRVCDDYNQQYLKNYFENKFKDEKDYNRIAAYKKYAFANFVGELDIFTKAYSSEKVSDVYKRLRNAYNKNYNDGYHFKFLSLMNRLQTDTSIATEFPDGGGIEISMIGKMKVGDRIKDLVLDSIVDGDLLSKWLAFVTYSLETDKEKYFSGFFNYMAGDASHEEAERIVKGFTFSLQNIEPNTKIGDAIEYVRKHV